MAQTIQLKRSALSGKVPGTGSLNLGELAVNTYDGKIFFKKSGSVESIQSVVTTNSITTGSIELVGNQNITGSLNITGSKPSGYGLVIESSTYKVEPVANELKNIMLLVLVDCTCTRTLAATPLDGQLTTLKLVVPVDAIEYF